MPASYLTDFRFGYGAFAGRPELSSMAMPGNDAARYPRLDGSAETISDIQSKRIDNARLRKKGNTASYRRAAGIFNRRVREHYLRNADARLRFTVKSGHPFFERLVYFWLNHFAVATKNQRSYMPFIAGFENEAIRPYVDGSFREMFRAAGLHPAMLLSLSQNASVGPHSPRGLAGTRGLNENLGRELLELYSLGADGGYRQNDVIELALLLTGLRVEPHDGMVSYRLDIAEPGTRYVMGRSYGGMLRTRDQIYDALDDLAVHPSTARHIARKLAGHFIADDPPLDLLADLEAVFVESDGYLPAVYAVLLDYGHRAAPMQKVRTPLDFMIAGLRGTGASPQALNGYDPTGGISEPNTMVDSMSGGMEAGISRKARKRDHQLPRALVALSHELWGSPGPDGFPDRNADWLHADGLAGRLSWAARIAHFVETPPQDFAREILGEVGSPQTFKIIGRAASREEAVALALMAPEFNRR